MSKRKLALYGHLKKNEQGEVIKNNPVLQKKETNNKNTSTRKFLTNWSDGRRS